MKDVVCLYEESGFSAHPWAMAGYDVYCYDILHEERRVETCGKGRKIFMPWDAKDHHQTIDLILRHMGHTAIVLGFPPCTDLAVSGAAWFAKKLKANPSYVKEAMALVYTVQHIGKMLECKWCLENPVSVISSQWRKPDFIFHPHEFGGYLPEDDVHPLYPEYINPRDAYPKKTCYWTGGGFEMPEKKPVPIDGGYSLQHKKLGGKSDKTKRIRSASPRGIAQAIFLAAEREEI